MLFRSFGDGPQDLVIADDADDVDGQTLAGGAEEEVGQAVRLLRHHEEGAHGAVDGVEGPAHAVGSGIFYNFFAPSSKNSILVQLRNGYYAICSRAYPHYICSTCLIVISVCRG